MEKKYLFINPEYHSTFSNKFIFPFTTVSSSLFYSAHFWAFSIYLSLCGRRICIRVCVSHSGSNDASAQSDSVTAAHKLCARRKRTSILVWERASLSRIEHRAECAAGEKLPRGARVKEAPFSIHTLAQQRAIFHATHPPAGAHAREKRGVACKFICGVTSFRFFLKIRGEIFNNPFILCFSWGIHFCGAVRFKRRIRARRWKKKCAFLSWIWERLLIRARAYPQPRAWSK